MAEPIGENREQPLEENELAGLDIIGAGGKESGREAEIARIEADYQRSIKDLELAQEDLISRFGINERVMNSVERKVEAARKRTTNSKGKKLEMSDFKGKERLVFLLIQERIKVEEEHSKALEGLMFPLSQEK